MTAGFQLQHVELVSAFLFSGCKESVRVLRGVYETALRQIVRLVLQSQRSFVWFCMLSRTGTETAASPPLLSKMLKMCSSNIVNAHYTVFKRADDTDMDKIAGTFL